MSKIVSKKMSINEIEKNMLKCEQIEIETKHTFSDGMYAREISAPAGALILGHEHKKPCLNILAQGKMILKDSREDEGRLIEAPYSFHTEPGIRKLAYVVEDVVFINVFRTDERDLDKLEDQLIVKSKEFLEGRKCLG